MSKVLVVDGDRAARDALVTCLKFVGMDAHGAENAAAARCWLETDTADVLVLAEEVAEGVSDPSSGVDRRTDARRSCAHHASSLPQHRIRCGGRSRSAG